MFMFKYAEEWANLVIGQLIARKHSNNPFVWGYGCLSASDSFDRYLEDHYYEINRLSGKHLNVFSFVAPPKAFLDERLKEMREHGAGSDLVAQCYQELSNFRAQPYAYSEDADGENYSEMRQREKNWMLQELDDAGIPVRTGDVFLFFDVRPSNPAAEEFDIDVIAALPSPEGADFSKLFARLGKRAAECYGNAKSVEEFVDGLKPEWSRRLAFETLGRVNTYLKMFLGPFKPLG